MALLTPEEIDAIATAVTAKMDDQRATCACGLPEAVQSEMGHICGMFRDLGGNDIAKGIEVMRDNNAMIAEVRQGMTVAKHAAIKCVATAVIAAIGLGLWLLVQVKLGLGKG
jgi:hypothetical protein